MKSLSSTIAKIITHKTTNYSRLFLSVDGCQVKLMEASGGGRLRSEQGREVNLMNNLEENYIEEELRG